MFRYKYLPLDEGSLRTITEGTIKFTCPLDFNDPFDCRPAIDLDAIWKLPKKRPDLWRAILKERGLSPANGIAKKREILTQYANEVRNGSFWDDLLGDVGVCSLTREPLDILMWSHYAKDHTGFCLEFEIPTTARRWVLESGKSLGWLFPLEVTYSKQRPTVPPYGDSANHADIEPILLTKSSHWGYEQEERSIRYDGGPGIYPYDQSKILRSVLCGVKMRSDDYEKIRNLVGQLNEEKNLHVGCYRVEEVRGFYELTVPRHPRLDKQ